MTRPFRYVGADIETTGTNPYIHSLIQIGVCSQPFARRESEEAFVSDVGGTAAERMLIEKEAMAVIGFTLARITLAPEAVRVDGRLEAFLRGLCPEGFNVPVGFNVGQFDMQFVRRELPESYKRFGYRCVDLNSVLFTLSECGMGQFDELKTKAKGYAEGTLRDMGFPTEKHDALWDAREALLCWKYLRGMLPRKVA
jgi:DNA polymerase III epsilon subunit-like protein